MGDYTITVRYEPGTPKTYRVLNAPDGPRARRCVLASIGYHPGVDIYTRDYRRGDTADYVIDWTPDEGEDIRLND